MTYIYEIYCLASTYLQVKFLVLFMWVEVLRTYFLKYKNVRSIPDFRAGTAFSAGDMSLRDTFQSFESSLNHIANISFFEMNYFVIRTCEDKWWLGLLVTFGTFRIFLTMSKKLVRFKSKDWHPIIEICLHQFSRWAMSVSFLGLRRLMLLW